MRKREFEILGEKLLDVGASDIRRFLDFDNFEDLRHQKVNRVALRTVLETSYVNGPEPSSMSRCHVLIESLDCFSP